jgi:co-chaperonin GroES (HSP10)
MIIKPFGDRILVKPIEHKTILVGDDGTLNEYGEVIAIGDAVKKINIGDKIGFSVFGIEKLVIEEEKFYFLQESPEFLLGTIIES